MGRHEENTTSTGIVNYGGNNSYSGVAVGKGATIVNGKVVKGEKVDNKNTNKKK